MVALGFALVAYWNDNSERVADVPDSEDMGNGSGETMPDDGEETSTDDVENDERERSLTSIERVDEELVGTWRATGETEYIVDFMSDGTLRYSYASGAAIEEGTYDTYNGLDELPERVREEARQYEKDTVFLREAFGSNEYYFVFRSFTDETFERIDLTEGGSETLERIEG